MRGAAGSTCGQIKSCSQVNPAAPRDSTEIASQSSKILIESSNAIPWNGNTLALVIIILMVYYTDGLLMVYYKFTIVNWHVMCNPYAYMSMCDGRDARRSSTLHLREFRV